MNSIRRDMNLFEATSYGVRHIKEICQKLGIPQGELGKPGYFILSNEWESIVTTCTVSLTDLEMEYIPISIVRVDGDFAISNSEIISWKNCPKFVSGMVLIQGVADLNTLEGSPRKIGGGFIFRGFLKNLVGFPDLVNGDFQLIQERHRTPLKPTAYIELLKSDIQGTIVIIDNFGTKGSELMKILNQSRKSSRDKLNIINQLRTLESKLFP